jgi:hypothetical protein
MDGQDLQQYFETRQSRRRVLQQLGALASVGRLCCENGEDAVNSTVF